MKKLLKYIPLIVLSVLFSSCLKSGLDDLPAFSDAEIDNFRFEYRWIKQVAGNDQLKVVQITTVKTIDSAAGTIACTLTVPAVSADFPAEVRDNVTLSNLVGYADISLAATMAPLDGAPALGEIADFSSASSYQYEVTAADGTKKIWTLTISGFNK